MVALLDMLADTFLVRRKKMESKYFDELSNSEQMEIDGGIFGVDDVAVATIFLAGAAIGAAIGCNRKNRG